MFSSQHFMVGVAEWSTTGDCPIPLQSLSEACSSLPIILPSTDCWECKSTQTTKRCSRCSTAFYCSRRCQKMHWDVHKLACNKLLPVVVLRNAKKGTAKQGVVRAAARALFDASSPYAFIGCDMDALLLLSSAVPLVEDGYGRSSAEYLALLQNIGALFNKMGVKGGFNDNYRGALLLASLGLQIHSELKTPLPDRRIEFLLTHLRLQCHKSLGDLHDEEYLSHSLSLHEIYQSLASAHRDKLFEVDCLVDIAGCHDKLGHREDAIHAVTQAAEIASSMEVDICNTFQVADALNTCACLFRQYEKPSISYVLHAKELIQREIVSSTEWWREQEKMKVQMNILVELVNAHEDLEEVRKAFDEGMDFCRSIPNSERARALLLYGLGRRLYSRNQPEEALEFFKQALGIETQLYGKQSIEVATTMTSVGSAYRELGDYSESLKHYEEAKKIVSRFGESHKQARNLRMQIQNHIRDLNLVFQKLQKAKEANKKMAVTEDDSAPDLSAYFSELDQDHMEALHKYNDIIQNQSKHKLRTVVNAHWRKSIILFGLGKIQPSLEAASLAADLGSQLTGVDAGIRLKVLRGAAERHALMEDHNAAIAILRTALKDSESATASLDEEVILTKMSLLRLLLQSSLSGGRACTEEILRKEAVSIANYLYDTHIRIHRSFIRQQFRKPPGLSLTGRLTSAVGNVVKLVLLVSDAMLCCKDYQRAVAILLEESSFWNSLKSEEVVSPNAITLSIFYLKRAKRVCKYHKSLVSESTRSQIEKDLQGAYSEFDILHAGGSARKFETRKLQSANSHYGEGFVALMSITEKRIVSMRIMLMLLPSPKEVPCSASLQVGETFTGIYQCLDVCWRRIVEEWGRKRKNMYFPINERSERLVDCFVQAGLLPTFCLGDIRPTPSQVLVKNLVKRNLLRVVEDGDTLERKRYISCPTPDGTYTLEEMEFFESAQRTMNNMHRPLDRILWIVRTIAAWQPFASFQQDFKKDVENMSVFRISVIVNESKHWRVSCPILGTEFSYKKGLLTNSLDFKLTARQLVPRFYPWSLWNHLKNSNLCTLAYTFLVKKYVTEDFIGGVCCNLLSVDAEELKKIVAEKAPPPLRPFAENIAQFAREWETGPDEIQKVPRAEVQVFAALQDVKKCLFQIREITCSHPKKVTKVEPEAAQKRPELKLPSDPKFLAFSELMTREEAPNSLAEQWRQLGKQYCQQKSTLWFSISCYLKCIELCQHYVDENSMQLYTLATVEVANLLNQFGWKYEEACYEFSGLHYLSDLYRNNIISHLLKLSSPLTRKVEWRTSRLALTCTKSFKVQYWTYKLAVQLVHGDKADRWTLIKAVTAVLDCLCRIRAALDSTIRGFIQGCLARDLHLAAFTGKFVLVRNANELCKTLSKQMLRHPGQRHSTSSSSSSSNPNNNPERVSAPELKKLLEQKYPVIYSELMNACCLSGQVNGWSKKLIDLTNEYKHERLALPTETQADTWLRENMTLYPLDHTKWLPLCASKEERGILPAIQLLEATIEGALVFVKAFEHPNEKSEVKENLQQVDGGKVEKTEAQKECGTDKHSVPTKQVKEQSGQRAGKRKKKQRKRK